MDIIQNTENLRVVLHLALQCMKKETQESTFDHRRDFCPNIFIFTNEPPADSWFNEAKAIKDSTRKNQRVRCKGLEFVVCPKASDAGFFLRRYRMYSPPQEMLRHAIVIENVH